MRAWGKSQPVDSSEAVAVGPASLPAELSEAYRRGRRDEARRHRRTPLITTALFAIALIGAVILFYAAREGSFAGGGQVVDAKVSHVTGEVVPNVVNAAATQTGEVVKSAGERLKQNGAALDRQSSSAPH